MTVIRLRLLICLHLLLFTVAPLLAQDDLEPPINWDMIDPTLTSPRGIATTTDSAPTFEWLMVEGAVRYEIQITATLTFLLELEVQEIVNQTTYTASPLQDGTYLWRVRGMDTLGAVSPWSDIRRLTIDSTAPPPPRQDSPAADGFVTSLRPTLTWFGVRGASQYQVIIDTTDVCNSPPSDAQPGFAYTAPEPLALGAYYWCVLSIDDAGNVGAISQPRRFFIHLGTAPSNNAVFFTSSPDGVAPRLEWSASGPGAYTVQIADNPFLDNALEAEVSGVTAYRPEAPLPYGIYYWLVIPEGSDASAAVPLRFVVSPPALPAPTLDPPALGGVARQSLTWSPVEGALTYEVEITRTGEEEPEITSVTVQGAGYSLELPQTPDKPTRFFWRARALNEYGVPGAWSDIGDFTLGV
jgi:hypothetical protein